VVLLLLASTISAFKSQPLPLRVIITTEAQNGKQILSYDNINLASLHSNISSALAIILSVSWLKALLMKQEEFERYKSYFGQTIFQYFGWSYEMIK
jgi:hypothetical protein